MCKLKKAIYGPRGSPKAWQTHPAEVLQAFGLHRSTAEPNIYYTAARGCYILAFARELLFWSGNNSEQDLRSHSTAVDAQTNRNIDPGLSRRRLLSLAHKRLLNIIVAPLNYQYLGRATSLEEIRRCPNTWQRSCSDRLRTLIAACGTDPEPFSLAPGRSGLELGAALFQLEQFVEPPEVAVGGYKGLYFQRFFDDPSLFPPWTLPV